MVVASQLNGDVTPETPCNPNFHRLPGEECIFLQSSQMQNASL
jgi:hypothetical protein